MYGFPELLEVPMGFTGSVWIPHKSPVWLVRVPQNEFPLTCSQVSFLYEMSFRQRKFVEGVVYFVVGGASMFSTYIKGQKMPQKELY